MTADDINGVPPGDELLVDDEHRMTVMDRLLEYCPAPAPPSVCIEQVPGRVRRRYRRDERAAAGALYGHRSGQVTALGADRPPLPPSGGRPQKNATTGADTPAAA